MLALCRRRQREDKLALLPRACTTKPALAALRMPKPGAYRSADRHHGMPDASDCMHASNQADPMKAVAVSFGSVLFAITAMFVISVLAFGEMALRIAPRGGQQ